MCIRDRSLYLEGSASALSNLTNCRCLVTITASGFVDTDNVAADQRAVRIPGRATLAGARRDEAFSRRARAQVLFTNATIACLPERKREAERTRSPDERQRNPGSAFKLPTRSRISRSLSSGRPLLAGPVGSSGLQIHPATKKGGGTPTDAYLQPPHPHLHPRRFGEDRGGGAARVHRDALACRRSTAALA